MLTNLTSPAMKRIILSLALSLFFISGVQGQIYLTDKYQPTSSKGYNEFTSKGKSVITSKYSCHVCQAVVL